MPPSATAVSDALARFFAQASYPIMFTGAGVSVRAGLPTWKQLIEKMAEGLRPRDPLMAQAMVEAVALGDYTLAVDYFNLNRKLLEVEKRQLLKQLLSTYDVAPILALAKLPFRACLTTNFDRSIFDAITSGGRRVPRDFKFGDASFAQAQWDEDSFVARIHGAIESPETMILSSTQFDKLLESEQYIDLLRTCFVHRNVIFLGFSFYDPAIRHIFSDIDKRFGGATPGKHMVFLPRDLNPEFLQKAARLNIEVVQYDSAGGHAELWDAINSFKVRPNSAEANSPGRTEPFDFTKRYLAACYARAKTHDSSAPLREAVLEGIVSALLQEAAPQAISTFDLSEKVRLSLGIKGRDADTILRSAIRSLVEAGLCRKLAGDSGRKTKFAWIGDAGATGSLDAAINALSESLANRAYLQEGWKTGKEVNDTMRAFFVHLIRRRGWDLGAAFAAGRAPENAAVQSLLNELCVGLTAFDRERLLRICSGMLQRPTEDESQLLGELGRVSFAVELAFQSPQTALLHKATLPRCIFFDASVLLPALVEGHPFKRCIKVQLNGLPKCRRDRQHL